MSTSWPAGGTPGYFLQSLKSDPVRIFPEVTAFGARSDTTIVTSFKRWAANRYFQFFISYPLINSVVEMWNLLHPKKMINWRINEFEIHSYWHNLSMTFQGTTKILAYDPHKLLKYKTSVPIFYMMISSAYWIMVTCFVPGCNCNTLYIHCKPQIHTPPGMILKAAKEARHLVGVGAGVGIHGQLGLQITQHTAAGSGLAASHVFAS